MTIEVLASSSFSSTVGVKIFTIGAIALVFYWLVLLAAPLCKASLSGRARHDLAFSLSPRGSISALRYRFFLRALRKSSACPARKISPLIRRCKGTTPRLRFTNFFRKNLIFFAGGKSVEVVDFLDTAVTRLTRLCFREAHNVAVLQCCSCCSVAVKNKIAQV